MEYFSNHQVTQLPSAPRVLNTVGPVVDTKDDPELDSVHVPESEADQEIDQNMILI